MNNPVKKRLFINVALIAGVAFLAIAVWLSPDQNKKIRPLTALESDNITRLRIERIDHPTIAISKMDDHWQMTEPINVPANLFRLNSLLNIAQENSYSDYAMSDINPIELGLDTSEVTLYLNEHKVRFGGKDPISSQRYTQVNNRLYLLNDHYLPLLKQPPSSFIDTRVLPDYLNVIEFQLPEFKVAKTDTGGWKIEPDVVELDADTIQDWVTRWRSLHASEVTYQPEIKQNKHPQAILQLADGNTIEFEIIQTDEWTGLYQSTQNIGYKLSTGALEPLLGKPKMEISEDKPSSEK